MAKNRVFAKGDKLQLPVPENTVSGQALVIGDLPCVAVTDRDKNGLASVQTDGVWRFTVKGKNKAGNTKIEVGKKVFMKGGEINANNEEGVFFGYVLEEVASGATSEVLVKVGAN
jgi:predicted RecA/RadA family phage recombinase